MNCQSGKVRLICTLLSLSDQSSFFDQFGLNPFDRGFILVLGVRNLCNILDQISSHALNFA